MLFRNPIVHKRQALDKKQVSLGQLNLDNFNQWFLDKIRIHNDYGCGVVTRIVLEVEAVLTPDDNSSPVVPGYLLPGLFDVDLFGGDDVKMSTRLGYHHSVREYEQHGTFVELNPTVNDLPANSDAPATRTFLILLDFEEPSMLPHPFWRCFPCPWYRTGRLEIKPREQKDLNGTIVHVTDATITPYIEIVDFDLSAFPIPSIVVEGYSSDKDPKPALVPGQFLRAMATLAPDTATFSDNLATITKLMFGKEVDGRASYPIPRNTDVHELVRTWMRKYSADAPIYSTLTGQKEYLRFGDPVTNASGKLHFIPLIDPQRGHSIKEAPDFGALRAEMEINNGDRAGTPDTIDFLFQQVKDRDAPIITMLLESIKKGLSSRFRTDEDYALFKGLKNPMRGPLLMNLR